MKFAAATLALAATTLAAPSTTDKRAGNCTFGSYACTPDNAGIQVCDVTGTWQYVGPCNAANGEVCQFLPQNGFSLPFCAQPAPAASVAKRNGRPGTDSCAIAGAYSCAGAYAIQVCDTQGLLQKVGDCPARTHCDYLFGVPYCVDSTTS